ncbi:hypothetical protein [Paenibacillus jiagnxiensis]|uniref:hypothetical protein n=1 Tax=Paenibacillus jiagnxiensis TaxID=3228926 RepID=UPI0033B411E4
MGAYAFLETQENFKDFSIILITAILFFLFFVAPSHFFPSQSASDGAARKILVRPVPETPLVVR